MGEGIGGSGGADTKDDGAQVEQERSPYCWVQWWSQLAYVFG